MEYSVMDDIDLIAVIGKLSKLNGSDIGMNNAVGILYDRFGRLVYSIAIHIVGDNETAEEITQDVFIKICEGARSYNPEIAKVSSWIISIARHRSIDEIRKRSTRLEKDTVDWPEDIGLEESNEYPKTDGPEEEVEGRIVQKQIQNVVSLLPKDQRETLRLAYFGGYSQQEIAEILHEPLGTVKSRIRLAMEKLRIEILKGKYQRELR